ncbi:hypothetical protein SAMN05444001_1111 [Parabacteroides chinchillae]|uniref:Uncharacterized protein n=1 Tax=Parabacteroides chinchillae TaxID=871327 RepID=A0A8G2BX00_9BACT|nr:hypothetical protein SAMN05444001_1111 [Parabacteroides chinchillae]
MFLYTYYMQILEMSQVAIIYLSLSYFVRLFYVLISAFLYHRKRLLRKNRFIVMTFQNHYDELSKSLR